MTNFTEAVKETNKLVINKLNSVSPGLNEITIYLTQAMGKGARTILLLNSSMNAEGLIPENAIKAAASVELLHMATLLHDDVIDDSPLRRGIETVQSKFGKKRAVICGDYLLCLSVSLIASVEHSEDMKNTELGLKFARALGNICHGEYRQYQNAGNIDLDVFTYLKIISGKTAALFYVSAYLGALLGDEDEKNARSIGRFGQCLGMIFQIIDDCKDYEFSEYKAQKSVGGDIAGGVVTLPLILAIKKDPVLRDLALDAIGTKQNISRLIEKVCHLGGTDDARTVAKKYEEKAIQALQNVIGIKKDNLLALLQNTLGAASKF